MADLYLQARSPSKNVTLALSPDLARWATEAPENGAHLLEAMQDSVMSEGLAGVDLADVTWTVDRARAVRLDARAGSAAVGRGEADPGVWYVLICRECDPDLEAPMPFGTPAERGRWAAEHTRGTGHDRWLVVDQPKEPAR
jgi:hypothetical protein